MTWGVYDKNQRCHNSNDTFEVLDEVAPSQNSKPKSTISTPQPHKKLRRCSTGVVGQKWIKKYQPLSLKIILYMCLGRRKKY